MKREKFPLVSEEIFDVVQFLLTPKVILGALRSAIHAHGPISTVGLTDGKLLILYQDKEDLWQVREISVCGASSAAKRIRGALKTRVEEYLERKEEKNSQKDV